MWTNLLSEKSALEVALELLGDKWTLKIVASNLAGVHRFNEIEQSLGINRNLLSSRLKRLIDANIIEKKIYRENPRRYNYQLTKIGEELEPVILSLSAWSENSLVGIDSPLNIVHDKCGKNLTTRIYCPNCETVI